MATIIAGGFDVAIDADAAVQRLKEAGVDSEFICNFRVNPPGQHGGLPAGGDHHTSAGAHEVGKGAGKGAAIGAAAGLVAGAAITPIVGPIGMAAGVAAGAYGGALTGGMKAGVDKEAQPGHDVVRPAENMIAVNTDPGPLAADEVIRIMEECGARQVESNEGRWANGEWTDFDPVSMPHLVGGRDAHDPREQSDSAPHA
jgi:hypothetical protein